MLGVGINEQTNNQQLEIFPNPAGDVAELKLLNTIANGTLEIISATGQIVYRKKLNENTGELTLSTNEFQKGFILYKLQMKKLRL